MNAHNLDSVGSLSATPLYVPVATPSRCLGCDADIVRYGVDDSRFCADCSKCPCCRKPSKRVSEDVKLCDGCLDCLAGDAEVEIEAVPAQQSTACCEGHGDHGHDGGSDDGDSDDEDTDEHVHSLNDPAGLDEVWGDKMTETLAAEAAECCATCATATAYRCKCGKLCCVGCVDEVGRCPACDSDG